MGGTNPWGGQTRGGDPSWGRSDPRKGALVSATLLPARHREIRQEEEGTSITPGGFPARADLGEVVPPLLYPPPGTSSPLRASQRVHQSGGERTRLSAAERGASSITQVGI